ncbi:MAG: helix-turn-helix domain-containing protein [Candidatus Omnitrophica bacterium]|nr:helix-turn-helix domain-containing protein [Candidatus Omnitrophota bacterium]
MPEHLLNIKEVAEYLGVSEDEVKRLVDIGEIPAYKIGDSFLRFRKEQIDAVRSEVSDVEKKDPNRIDIKPDVKDRHVRAQTERFDYTFTERVRDFFYYNDFYILAAVIIAILLLVILRS